MSEKATLIIMLNKIGDQFRADLHAPSELDGVADLRLHHVGSHAVEVIEACLEELQAKAADGDAIALRFA